MYHCRRGGGGVIWSERKGSDLFCSPEPAVNYLEKTAFSDSFHILCPGCAFTPFSYCNDCSDRLLSRALIGSVYERLELFL